MKNTTNTKKAYKKKKKKKFNLFKKNKNKFTFEEVFAITIFSILLGAFSVISILTIVFKGKNFIKIGKDLDKFTSAYEVILDNYYGDIDKNKLIDSAIEGMVNSVGDVYTSYSDIETSENFNTIVNGEYEGIGCLILKVEDGITVYHVYEDSPADKAGLKEKDIILSVDEKDTKDMSLEDLSTYIRETKKKEVTLKVKRDNTEKEITIKKSTVEIPSVTGEIIERNNKKIGYIGISLFSSVGDKQFHKQLEKLENDGIDSLIIDVRGNSGGYLSTVVNISSYLLPKGKTIYQVELKGKKTKYKDETKESRDYPIAVLIDNGSASASEILASVIKESYEGLVVGTTSYGKGTVQQVSTLKDGSMIKYTIENWLTPKGNWINEKGVTPTNEVKLNEEYYKDPKRENDNQLEEALNLLSK